GSARVRYPSTPLEHEGIARDLATPLRATARRHDQRLLSNSTNLRAPLLDSAQGLARLRCRTSPGTARTKMGQGPFRPTSQCAGRARLAKTLARSRHTAAELPANAEMLGWHGATPRARDEPTRPVALDPPPSCRHAILGLRASR